MDDTTTLGGYLRAERERRGLALKTISENTKVSLPLLEGLESDDISRWPGGIFRRAFVRSYAESVGLDPDDVFRRFEQQHRPPAPVTESMYAGFAAAELAAIEQGRSSRLTVPRALTLPNRARYLGTGADLTVAAILAFGSAAAGSRLLWPVLMIAAYYAAGVLLTGTSPMVALLSESESPASHPPGTTREVDPLLDHSSASSIS
jgi:transcriptional regulator with XRE-family HTH domain